MNATKLGTAVIEKQIKDKMQEILDIVNEVEPGHGIIDIAIDDGYFSLRCCGTDGTEDMHRLLNFSRHEKEVKESFIIRDVPHAPGIEIVNDDDLSPEEYRIWHPRTYVKSKPRKDGRLVMD